MADDKQPADRRSPAGRPGDATPSTSPREATRPRRRHHVIDPVTGEVLASMDPADIPRGVKGKIWG